MSEEDLELMITLDDPGDAQEDDIFNHPQAENTLEYWLGQRFPERHLIKNDGTTNDSMIVLVVSNIRRTK